MIPHRDKCSGRTNSTLLACLSQGASKFILEGSSDGLLWLATLANHGEKRHLYSNSTYSAIMATQVGRGMGTNESRSCCIVAQIVNHKFAHYIRRPYLDSNQQRKTSRSYIGCFDFDRNSSRRGCGRYAPKNETTCPLGFTRIPTIEAG